MIRRVLVVLLAALATVCASAVGFADAPAIHQLVFLVLACVFGAGLQVAAVQKSCFHCTHCGRTREDVPSSVDFGGGPVIIRLRQI